MRSEPCYCGDPGCGRCYPVAAASFVAAELCDGCPYADDEEMGEDVCTRMEPSRTCPRYEDLEERGLAAKLLDREG